MGFSNVGASPLDKIADIAGAIGQRRDRSRQRRKDVAKAVKPKTITSKAAKAACNAIGVTHGACKHKGVKRGQTCPGCSARIM